MTLSKSWRRFTASYTFSNEVTGIGIVEHVLIGYSTYTKAIQSIYIDKRITHTDAQREVLKIIRYDLDEGERAKLRMTKIKLSNAVIYKSIIATKYVTYKTGITYEAEILAKDALKRQTTIKESLADGPIYFSVLNQEKEEKAEAKE